MIIYKDIITGDEIISDTWGLKEVDGAVYEVDGKKYIPGKEADNFDIGANASKDPDAPKETEESAMDDGSAAVEPVIDVIVAFRLEETSRYSKKQYLTYLKSYMKRVKEAMMEKGADEATIKEFETNAQGYAKELLGKIDQYDFYTGSSQDPDGMLILLNWREDGMTPYLTIWKHGLTEMKV